MRIKMLSKAIRTKSFRSAASRACLCIGLIIAPISGPTQQPSGGSAAWLQCTSDGRSDSIGINLGNIGFPGLKNDPVIQALDQSDAKWARISLYWGWTNRLRREEIDWQPIDDGLKRLAQAHVHTVITLDGGVPCWALGNPEGCTLPLRVAPPASEWADWVSAVVTRYKNQVHYWELWNEPDLHPSIEMPDPEQRLIAYRDQILIPGAEAIHQADPAATVIAPAFAGIPAGNTAMGSELRNAVVLVLRGSASKLVDIVSFHSYWPEDINSKAIQVRNAMRQIGMGDKPIWITEMGLGPERLNLLDRAKGAEYLHQQQASILKNQMETVLSHGTAQKVFWFALTDNHPPSDPTAENYGMIDVQGQIWHPRPPFKTLQSLVQQSCGAPKQ